MKKSRLFTRSLILIVLLTNLQACDIGPAPIENRAGEWKVETEFGSFRFMVSDTGTEITDLNMEYKVGIVSGELTIEGSNMTNTIEEDGSFDLSNSEFNLIFFGRFSEDARSVSGLWAMDVALVGNLSEAWEVER